MKRNSVFATSIKLNSFAYIVSALASETFLALKALINRVFVPLMLQPDGFAFMCRFISVAPENRR